MIDNFKQFELKRSTYQNAADIARSYGQLSRSNKLRHWADVGTKDKAKKTPYQLGVFNFFFSVYSLLTPRVVNGHTLASIPEKKAYPLDWDSHILARQLPAGTQIKEIAKGPIGGYITDVGILDDVYDDTDGVLLPIDFITIVIHATYIFDGSPIRVPGMSSPFSIRIPIEWSAGTFTIGTSEESPIFHMEEIPIVFSDRQSAVRFKKILNNIGEYIDGEKLKLFFMEFSYAEEYQKFLNFLKNMSVNRLYKN